MGTGWFAADAANVKPGSTVAVVGDGAVGLLGVLSAKQMGAERIVAMSRHQSRQQLAREFGATDIVSERGDEGVAVIKDLTKGVGVDSVLECVGTPESMEQAIRITRPGGSVGYVGIPHGVELDAADLFFRTVTGFGAGDVLDFADLGLGATLEFTANADGSGGTLTLSDGTHTAAVNLAGNYQAGGFTAAYQQGAGVLVTYDEAHIA